MRRLAVTAALVAAFTALPWGAQADPLGSRDLPRLTAELEAATARAQALSDQLAQAAQRDGGLRVAFARLDDQRYDAQLALDNRARQVFMGAAHDPVADLETTIAEPTMQVLAHRSERASLTVDQALVDAVTQQSDQVRALQRQADAFRRQLLGQAVAVLEEQDRARELYQQAKAIADAEQAAEVQARLEAQRTLLDQVSTTVTLSLTPAQTRRSKAALEREAPVVALLERSGSGYPEGYAPTGQVEAGQASWYGPGFVGNPTASGAPYDPERLTCAHKTLPLGTVVRVTRGALSVSCLVNDRGPYVAGRIIDMSRAGSRALGYSGVAEVTVEVLAPV